MQPDSVTQVFGLLLVQLGIPAPFSVLIAVLSLFMVPALIVGVVDVQMARRERAAWTRTKRSAKDRRRFAAARAA
jgi:hypothetical protein